MLKYKDIPTTITTNFMNSVAYPFTGIVLFNNFAEKDGKIRAIEFFTSYASSQFELNVIIFCFYLKT